jgi:RTX calcium-binding nonapeptide repeat (4 copies)
LSRSRPTILVLLVLAGTICLGATTPQATGSGATASVARCTVSGTAGADRLKGTPRRDVICGRGGADMIRGLSGNDRLVGGKGDDVLLGGKGNDVLLGGPGSDRLVGGPGADRIYGGGGADSCPGTTAADLVRCPSPQHRISWPAVPPPPPPPQVCGVATRPPDECAPKLLGVGVSPRSRDANLGPAEVELIVYAFDENKIASIQAQLRGPGGFARTVSLLAKNKFEYEFIGSTTLAETAALGTYWIDHVSLVDAAGNSVAFDEAALAAGGFGFWREFELYDGPDTEGPVIEGLTISPTSVDTSGGPATVTMTVHATDSLSGIRSIDGGFQMPNQPSNFTYGFSMPLVQGKARDGAWQVQIPLPRHATPGEWRLDNLHLHDDAGNDVNYSSHSELESLPFPLSFTQTGPGDTTSPQIRGLTIEEDNSSGQHAVYFNVHVADDLAGVLVDNCLWLETRSVAQPTYTFAVTSPIMVSGTALDSVLRVGTVFPGDAPAGTYRVESIEACDLTWNLAKLSGPELEAKGWDLTFENPG